MKSEPQVYSIADLEQERETIWSGVRNYQALNFLRQMEPGDKAFFYHSNTTPPGVVGLMRIVTSNISDPTQFDPSSIYYDPKSSLESPWWQTVVVEFVEAFPHSIALETLKLEFSPDQLAVVRKGNRLSVMPVIESVAKKLVVMAHNWISYS